MEPTTPIEIFPRFPDELPGLVAFAHGFVAYFTLFLFLFPVRTISGWVRTTFFVPQGVLRQSIPREREVI